jgi:hypothetical protein
MRQELELAQEKRRPLRPATMWRAPVLRAQHSLHSFVRILHRDPSIVKCNGAAEIANSSDRSTNGKGGTRPRSSPPLNCVARRIRDTIRAKAPSAPATHHQTESHVDASRDEFPVADVTRLHSQPLEPRSSRSHSARRRSRCLHSAASTPTAACGQFRRSSACYSQPCLGRRRGRAE